MKKFLYVLAAFLLFNSCQKDCHDGNKQVRKDCFSASKLQWTVGTRAGSALDSVDEQWQSGDEVTVFSENGEFHNFKILEYDGLTATFDSHDYTFMEGERYKLYYPSLPAGWLEDRLFVLTYNFVQGIQAQEVGDWRCSDWVVPTESNTLSFTLEHMNSLLNLELSHPADGTLRRCYLRALPVNAGKEEASEAIKANYGFCYKDRYIYNGSEFVRDTEGGCNKMYEFNLKFDTEKEYIVGEVMKSITPINSDDYSELEDLHLILVYTNGKVFCSKVTLPDMVRGICYTIVAKDFQELSEVPFSDISW